jgi:hypothetical protein
VSVRPWGKEGRRLLSWSGGEDREQMKGWRAATSRKVRQLLRDAFAAIKGSPVSKPLAGPTGRRGR